MFVTVGAFGHILSLSIFPSDPDPEEEAAEDDALVEVNDLSTDPEHGPATTVPHMGFGSGVISGTRCYPN